MIQATPSSAPIGIKYLRFVFSLYPFQIGKGWVAAMFKDHNIPTGDLVRTKEGVLVRTRPDYVFKHAYLFREFEPVNTAVFKQLVRPGEICFDVGANFGFYTCLFARLGARVYAFEPVPTTFALNQETIRLNGCEVAVTSLNCGLGEQPGSIRIYQFTNLSSGHAGASDLGRADAVPQDCPINTIDAFCAKHGIGRISFIKIDVEGFEYEVLKGGKATLSKPNAPTVHFEVNAECMHHRQMNPNQIITLLRSYGYAEFLQIKRYGGVRPAPAILPLANYDYLAFKDRDLVARLLRS